MQFENLGILIGARVVSKYLLGANDMVFFSVIIPVYNIDEYLPLCLNSVLSQSFSNYEIIIVDDGSTDQSGSICDAYSKKKGKIKVIHKKNGGLSAARNTGINEAKGTYLVFIDGDDFIEPDSFEKIYASVPENLEPDVLITKIKEVYKDSEIKFPDPPMPKQREVYKAEVIDWVFKKSVVTWPAPKYIVRRSFIIKNNINFPKGFLHEDLDWTSKIFLHAKSFLFVDYYWYNHRMRRIGSISTSKKPKGLQDVILIAGNNIRNETYKELGERERDVIFKRLVKSVFYKLRDYCFFDDQNKKIIIELFKSNKEIFMYAEKFRHKIFANVCNLMGFKVALYFWEHFYLKIVSLREFLVGR